jgi:hypothetical protein
MIRPTLFLMLLAGAAAFALPAPTPPHEMVVYKSPYCGCCAKWVDHIRAAGITVTVIDTADLEPIKARHGVTGELGSCHTALVDGYVIEGHVPADLVLKLVTEKPALRGLAVPGMVSGSPGMEGPNPQRYAVLSFDRSGKTAVYARR